MLRKGMFPLVLLNWTLFTYFHVCLYFWSGSIWAWVWLKVRYFCSIFVCLFVYLFDCLFVCLFVYWAFKVATDIIHGQPSYIWISKPGQPFRSQFLLYLALWTGLAGATRLTRPESRLYASYRLNLLLLKGQRCVVFNDYV